MRSKIGLHIIPNRRVTNSSLLELAKTGRLAGVTVVDDYELANLLAPYVPYVLYRDVATAYDNPPALYGSEADFNIGLGWWYDTHNQQTHVSLDRRIILQPWGCNEQNQPRDAWFYKGLMTAAATQQRRLGIFADSLGTPDQWYDTTTGKLRSAVWELRRNSGCLAQGKQGGHFAVLHEYGPMGPSFSGNEPGSGYYPDGRRDDRAWPWFGGRHIPVYRDLLTEADRMPIILGECGAARTTVADMEGGLQGAYADLLGYQQRYAAEPYVVSCNYWTVGGSGAWGWSQSMIDDLLPQLLSHLKAM